MLSVIIASYFLSAVLWMLYVLVREKLAPKDSDEVWDKWDWKFFGAICTLIAPLMPIAYLMHYLSEFIANKIRSKEKKKEETIKSLRQKVLHLENLLSEKPVSPTRTYREV